MKSPRTNFYNYEGSDVLVNLRGIREGSALERFERTMSGERTLTMPAIMPLTEEGYKQIHRHLLQDVYEWAGTYRNIPTARESGPFCKPEYVGRHMRERFEALAKERYLKGLTRPEFSRRAAEHVNELNAIHPFVEGNGRVNRAFLATLGRQAGHEIDLSKIDRRRWYQATYEGHRYASNEGLADIIDLAVGNQEGSAPPTPPSLLRPQAREARNEDRDRGKTSAEDGRER